MKKTTLLLAFCLLANLAFAQQKDDKQLFTNFDKMLSEQFKTNETGATALVARKGQIVYKKAFIYDLQSRRMKLRHFQESA